MGGGGGVGGGNGGVEGTWKAVGDLSRGAAEKGGGGSSNGGGNGGSSTSSSSSEEDSSVAKDDGKCHHGLVLDVATAQLDAATSSLDDDDGGGASVLATSLSSSIESAAMASISNALDTAISYEPQVPPAKPVVIVISGPSGVGKDAVIKRLQERRSDLHFVVTATSRPRRPGEVDGIDYFFVSRDKFESMIANDELLEHALVYGEYKGIPKAQVFDKLRRGQDVVLRLDVQGARTMRKLLPDSVFVFLVAESEAALVKRLMARKTEPLEKAIVRVQTAREELADANRFDYVVVNRENELEETVSGLDAIFRAERLRVARMLKTAEGPTDVDALLAKESGNQQQ